MDLDDIIGATGGEKHQAEEATEKEPPRNPKDDRKRTAHWARKLETQLTDLYTAVGAGAAMAGDSFTSSLMGAHAPVLAGAWVDLAEQDSNVRHTLERLMTGGAWGGVIITHIMVIIPIVSYHGWIPGELGRKLQIATAMMMPTPDFGPESENGSS